MPTGPESILEYRMGEAETALKRGAASFGAIKAWAAGAVLTALGSLGGAIWSNAQRAERLEHAVRATESLRVEIEAVRGTAQEQRVRIEGLLQALDYERKRGERLEGQLERLQERKR